MQKFIDIALVVLTIFEVVKSTTFPKAFDTKKPNVNKVKWKTGQVHPVNLPSYREGFSKNLEKIHFCGWLFL